MNETQRLISKDAGYILPINTSNKHKVDELTTHLTHIILRTSPSTSHFLRQGIKITLIISGSLLSYPVCIPSVLTAGKFNPFPGASLMSSLATVIN